MLLAKKDSPFDADRPDDDLSPAFGAETLAERAMIPEGFANMSGSRTVMLVGVIGGGRYLKVNRGANLRTNLTLRILNYGFEYWSERKFQPCLDLTCPKLLHLLVVLVAFNKSRERIFPLINVAEVLSNQECRKPREEAFSD
jgi:hypothetical protein